MSEFFLTARFWDTAAGTKGDEALLFRVRGWILPACVDFFMKSSLDEQL